MQKFLFPFVLSVSILLGSLIPFRSASAMPPILPADPVEFGTKIDSAGILAFLQENGLLDVVEDLIIPSPFLRMVSGMSQNTPVSDSDSFLSRLFGSDNELYYTKDGSGVVQEHNGQGALINGVSDLWLMSGNMSDNTLIPYNYSAQYPGIDYVFNNTSFSACPVLLSDSSPFGTYPFYILPLCSSGSNLYYSSVSLLFKATDNTLYYDGFDSKNFSLISSSSQKVFTFGSGVPGSSIYFDFAYSPLGGIPRTRSSVYDYGLQPNGSYNFSSQGNAVSFTSMSWLDSSSGLSSPLSNGDISYLIYTNTPLFVPIDFPSGNFVYNDNPSDMSGSVIVSPDWEYAALMDFMTNGFKFTGSVDVQGNYDINASVNLSGSLGVNHSGDITINFNDDLYLWADDGKSTDFGNGVSLDGNAFNDGFKWLIDGASAVPVVLQQFTFIPPPVLAIITSGIVVMVFLGLWRTFKG